jgi:hypothetical protein
MSQDTESQVANNKEASLLLFSWTSQVTSLGTLSSKNSASLFVMELNSYYANHSRKQKSQDILDAVDTYFSSDDLSRKSCISVYTDGVLSMSGSLERCIVLPKQMIAGIVFTHCFLQNGTLISKSVVPEVQKLLFETNKLVNYIKSRPLQPRLSAFCRESCSHTDPTAHGSNVATRGRVLSRFHEVREEFIIFLTLRF